MQLFTCSGVEPAPVPAWAKRAWGSLATPACCVPLCLQAVLAEARQRMGDEIAALQQKVSSLQEVGRAQLAIHTPTSSYPVQPVFRSFWCRARPPSLGPIAVPRAPPPPSPRRCLCTLRTACRRRPASGPPLRRRRLPWQRPRTRRSLPWCKLSTFGTPKRRRAQRCERILGAGWGTLGVCPCGCVHSCERVEPLSVCRHAHPPVC